MPSWIYQHVRWSLFKLSVKVAWKTGKIQLIRLRERNILQHTALVASWQPQQKEPQCRLLCSDLSVLRAIEAEQRLVVPRTEKSIPCLWAASLARTGTLSFFIPWKSIAMYLNNKPWVSKSVKNTIAQRNIRSYLRNSTGNSEPREQAAEEGTSACQARI